MAQVFNKIYVDVRTKNNDIITAVQNDSNSRFLDVSLLDNGLPINLTGHEVRIYGKKADGKEIYNNGTITEATNGRCQFELTDQALAVAQDLTVQIVLYYNNVQILQSLPFTIHVVESLISNGSIPSSNEYGALVVLYQNLYEAYDLMTTMTQNQGNKGEISTERNIETFWQMIEYMAKYLDTDIANLLSTVLSEANIQGVIDRLGNAADISGTTIFGKLNNGVVKNIQRGVAATPRTTDKVITINLSAVDPTKCLVILDNNIVGYGMNGSSATDVPLYGATIISFTTTVLKVSGNYATYNDTYGSIGWQVIEFY
ncbi:BppU family phage baseplate upper protein [Anaerotignum sp.]|uniref:BppU family phage baseplate upper protein n=1 Tax=Anaerotignum sp. TaxID=2039241 RepID=UPI0033224B77